MRPGLKRTPHLKATVVNASRSPTLYYFEPFPHGKGASGPWSDGFRCH